jgi:hypothetical protein
MYIPNASPSHGPSINYFSKHGPKSHAKRYNHESECMAVTAMRTNREDHDPVFETQSPQSNTRIYPNTWHIHPRLQGIFTTDIKATQHKHSSHIVQSPQPQCAHSPTATHMAQPPQTWHGHHSHIALPPQPYRTATIATGHSHHSHMALPSQPHGTATTATWHSHKS